MSASPRIISLLPSSTEIVCALGFRDSLVGRSHECDHPPGVESLPVCTAPRFEVGGSSKQIDERVKNLVRHALSVYEVDEAALARLKADVIVTQSQCDVCAVSLGDVEQAVARTSGHEVAIVSLEADSVAGVWEDVRRVAKALGVDAAGHTLAGRLDLRVRTIAERARVEGHRPRVLCIEWIEPLMAAGNWMPELIQLAGGDSVLAEHANGGGVAKSPWIDWKDVEAAAPEVVLVAPCGFDMARTREELDLLTGSPSWRKLPAVRDRRVHLVDGNQYFNRPGPRLVESAEILAEILHPDAFSFGHEGTGWERVA